MKKTTKLFVSLLICATALFCSNSAFGQPTINGEANLPTTTAYTVSNNPVPIGKIIIAENFDKFTTGNTTDISASLNDYTTNAGWTGSKVYSYSGTAKMGTGDKLGYIELPELDLSQDTGRFYVAFLAKAWDKDATSMNLIVNETDTTIVTPLDNLKDGEYEEYVYFFDKNVGTTNTSIRLEGVQAKKGRFYLDSIRVYQVRPNVISIDVMPADVNIKTVQTIAASTSSNVKGNLLTNNITVISNNPNFTVPPTLDKDAAMGVSGVSLEITYTAPINVAIDSAIITLTSTSITTTIKVKANADAITTLNSLSALRTAEKEKYYRISSEVILIAEMDLGYLSQKWVQDTAAGIIIYDASRVVTTEYSLYDGITGMVGKLSSHYEQLQFIPYINFDAATSTANTAEPIVLTIAELNASGTEYESRLVRVNDLEMVFTDSWGSNEGYKAFNGEDTLTIYTFIRESEIVGERMPKNLDLIAIAGTNDGNVQVSPRINSDIIELDNVSNENVETFDVSIYPNPSNGQFNISLPLAAHIEIFTLTGISLGAKQVTAGIHEFQLDQSGIYFIKVITAEGLTNVQKILVK